MSIVMLSVLETRVASAEADALHRRLEARLERIAQESAVPVGAHWENPPAEEPVQTSTDVPSAGTGDLIVAVEARTVDHCPTVAASPPLDFQAHLERDSGPRVTRAVSRPRSEAAPARPVSVRPAETSVSAATRRAAIRTTPNR